MKKLSIALFIMLGLHHILLAQELKHFKDKKDRYGYKNSEGKVVIEPQFQFAADFTEGLGGVQQNDRWGFVDATGKVVIPIQYDNVYTFSDGLATVNTGATKGDMGWSFGGKWGFIDKTGTVVIPIIYDKAGSFSEGLAPVNKGATKGNYGMVGGKFGFIDKTGKEIIPFLFDNATGFSDGLASVASEGKEGFIDPTGKVVIPFMYDRTCAFQHGLAFVKKDGKCGYVNTSGQAAIPLIYDDADYYFKNGLAAVKQADLYGYIDRTGKLIVPCQYKNAHGFNEGLASVQLGDKWGFIDTTGTLVIDARYDYAGFFTDGVAEVKFEGKDMKISRNDKSIFEKKAVAVNAGQEKNVPKLTGAEEEELVRQMLQLNKAHKGPLFEKVNELNNALKPTMIVNSKGEINRQQWRSRALELKKSSLPEAQKQAEAYEKELAALPAGVQQLDLHLAITAYLQEVNRFIKSCDAWADLIYEIVADAEQVSEMMQHIETQLQSMNLGYHFLNKLTEEYALSKSKTGKYLTTMKAAK